MKSDFSSYFLTKIEEVQPIIGGLSPTLGGSGSLKEIQSYAPATEYSRYEVVQSANEFPPKMSFFQLDLSHTATADSTLPTVPLSFSGFISTMLLIGKCFFNDQHRTFEYRKRKR